MSSTSRITRSIVIALGTLAAVVPGAGAMPAGPLTSAAPAAGRTDAAQIVPVSAPVSHETRAPIVRGAGRISPLPRGHIEGPKVAAHDVDWPAVAAGGGSAALLALVAAGSLALRRKPGFPG